jgi:hypothetical protein
LESALGYNKLGVAFSKEGSMTIEPRVFEMRVSEAWVLEERSRDAGDELCSVMCSVEAGEG